MYLIVLNQGCVSRENYDDLQTRFDTAEMALADKQKKIDEMKMEIFQKEKELETISVFQAQVQTIVWLAGHPPIYLSSLQLHHYLLLWVFVYTYRQRYIPRISTQNEQLGRRFTKRKSVWQISWSM